MANQSLVRHVNERRLLGMLRLEGALSRAELARRLALTRAAVTGMVDDLMARRLVREMPETGAGEARRDVGRPGTGIAIDPQGASFLGVEIGVGVVRFARLDLAGQVIETEAIGFATQPQPDEIVALLADRLATLAAASPSSGAIRRLGVTVPGLVRANGRVINLPILGWRDVDLGRLIADRIALPCRVENNANAAAFGHIYAGRQAPAGVVVYLKIGNGCGGAVIVDGRLLRGVDGLGSEFGHMRIAEAGPPCSCGRHGCLETFVNLKALRRELGPDASPVPDLDLPALVAGRLAAGDATATRAVDSLAARLVEGLVAITNIFNPAEIVIGGSMLPVLDAIVARVRKPLAGAIVPGMPVPVLTVSRVGVLECAIGAAALAHHQEFDLSNLDLRA